MCQTKENEKIQKLILASANELTSILYHMSHQIKHAYYTTCEIILTEEHSKVEEILENLDELNNNYKTARFTAKTINYYRKILNKPCKNNDCTK